MPIEIGEITSEVAAQERGSAQAAPCERQDPSRLPCAERRQQRETDEFLKQREARVRAD